MVSSSSNGIISSVEKDLDLFVLHDKLSGSISFFEDPTRSKATFGTEGAGTGILDTWFHVVVRCCKYMMFIYLILHGAQH